MSIITQTTLLFQITLITTIRSVENSSNCSRVRWQKSFVKRYCNQPSCFRFCCWTAKNLKQGKPKFFGRTHKLEKSEKSNKITSKMWAARGLQQIKLKYVQPTKDEQLFGFKWAKIVLYWVSCTSVQRLLNRLCVQHYNWL